MLLSGSVTGSTVEASKAFFESKIRIIHLDQSGEWSQPEEVAAKVDT